MRRNCSKIKSQEILIETETDEKQPLVLTNVQYPGWQAYIDGIKTKIYNADAIFQLIEVPQGKHQIKFIFRPDSFYNGMYVSLFSLAAIIFAALIIWRKKYL